MDKTFQVEVYSTVTPDDAFTTEHVADAVHAALYEVERQFGMGAIGVSVIEVDPDDWTSHDGD